MHFVADADLNENMRIEVQSNVMTYFDRDAVECALALSNAPLLVNVGRDVAYYEATVLARGLFLFLASFF